MKFQAKAADLAAACGAASRVIDTKCQIPLLGNVLVTASEGAVAITGHDLDQSLTVTCPAEVAQSDSITVPGERLTRLLAGIDGDVKVETADNAFVIRSGRSRYKLATLPAADFPAPLTVVGAAELELEAEAVRRLFVVPLPAISTEATRYYLNGIYLCQAGGQLVTCATNGFNLIKTSIAMPAGTAGGGIWRGVIIPRAAVVEIGRLAKYAPFKVKVDDKRFEVAAGPFHFGTKLIDGAFPDYARVIPSPSGHTIEVDRLDLMGALARVDAVAAHAKNVAAVVGLTWGGDAELRLCLTTDIEAANDLLKGSVVTGECRVAASINFLNDVLGAHEAETVKLDCGGGRSPILITADDILGLCMPCRWEAPP
ncbi:MAG TPA: DNA polymerase III subunit beta [Xanthobacteraceae bacterium]|jgi:DNA polymerase-3 subunit beta|nr:DNA polymerase III subunit beta [Xanthobacteraceae bacterium]